jgi:hypothetical protein
VPVIDDKISDKNGSDPGDCGEISTLRAVALSLRKDSMIGDVRKDKEEEDKKISFLSPEGLDEPQKRKNVDG